MDRIVNHENCWVGYDVAVKEKYCNDSSKYGGGAGSFGYYHDRNVVYGLHDD